MKGLLVFLAIVAVAYAGVPAERGIIDDILAVKDCLEGVAASVQGTVASVVDAIRELQATIDSNLAALRDCVNVGDISGIAQCISNAANNLRDEVTAGIVNIQVIVGGLLSTPDDIVACFQILG